MMIENNNETVAHVGRLSIFPSQQRGAQIVTNVLCQENHGIVGDRYAVGGRRQVSIIDSDLSRLDQQPSKLNGSWSQEDSLLSKGLCIKRFKGNIEMIGLDFTKLKNGSLLQIGDVVLQINRDGKKCYQAQCESYQAGALCPALRGCCFAQVVQSGEVKVGDSVICLPLA